MYLSSFYLEKSLVNNQIPNKEGKLRYKRFYEIFDFIFLAKRHTIIIKRDIIDIFWNVLISLLQQLFLGFSWENNFYKETCLSFICARDFIDK